MNDDSKVNFTMAIENCKQTATAWKKQTMIKRKMKRSYVKYNTMLYQSKSTDVKCPIVLYKWHSNSGGLPIFATMVIVQMVSEKIPACLKYFWWNGWIIIANFIFLNSMFLCPLCVFKKLHILDFTKKSPSSTMISRTCPFCTTYNKEASREKGGRYYVDYNVPNFQKYVQCTLKNNAIIIEKVYLFFSPNELLYSSFVLR